MTTTKSVLELFDLSGRVALVTGGAGWLGKAITESLVEQNARVIVASRNIQSCSQFVKSLNSQFPKADVNAISLDITCDKSVESCFDWITENFQKLDILVNNAHSGNQVRLETTSANEWNALLNASLTGYFRCSKAAIHLMQKHKSGSIINMSSMYGIVSPDPVVYEGTDFINSPAYGAAKAGIIQLTKYSACFFGKDGIRVNAISPGPFPQDSVQETKAFADKLVSKTALGRLGRPDDLKGAVVFLASDASSYVTGHNLVVDGGWTAS